MVFFYFFGGGGVALYCHFPLEITFNSFGTTCIPNYFSVFNFICKDMQNFDFTRGQFKENLNSLMRIVQENSVVKIWKFTKLWMSSRTWHFIVLIVTDTFFYFLSFVHYAVELPTGINVTSARYMPIHVLISTYWGKSVTCWPRTRKNKTNCLSNCKQKF